MRKLLRWIVKALHIKAEPWEVALARRRHNAYLREHDPLWRAASAWGRQITREHERWRQRQKMGLLGAGEAEGYQAFIDGVVKTQTEMMASAIPDAGPRTEAERVSAAAARVVERLEPGSHPLRKK